MTDAEWDEDAERWRVTTNRGDHIDARFVVICGGVLHKAKLPGIPGIETSRARPSTPAAGITRSPAASPEEPMDKLADKSVGIIGTGATAVQAVPKLAKAAKELYVFQRTPSAVGVRNQRPTDVAWFEQMSSEPAGSTSACENFTDMITGGQPEVDIVGDGWTELS